MDAMKRRKTWPLFLIGLPAAVAVWSGWVGLGGLCGFGLIHPLPGIVDSFQLNTAITLPIGVEAYGGYALGVWADAATPERVRKFAFRSAIGSLVLGLLGQVVFHLLAAAHYTHAPWPVVVFVSCIPVAALGFGMGLHQLLIHTVADEPAAEDVLPAEPVPAAQVLDEMARTITRRIPEPERWPSEPAPRADAWPTEGLPAPEIFDPADEVVPAAPEVVHPEQDADRPGEPAVDEVAPDVPEVVRSSPVDEIDREAAELFGSDGSSAAPATPPAEPRPPARTRQPAKARPGTEWTPESVGRTEAEVIELARTLTRNKLAETLPCSRSTADKLRAKYLQPEMAGR